MCFDVHIIIQLATEHPRNVKVLKSLKRLHRTDTLPEVLQILYKFLLVDDCLEVIVWVEILGMKETIYGEVGEGIILLKVLISVDVLNEGL